VGGASARRTLKRALAANAAARAASPPRAASGDGGGGGGAGAGAETSPARSNARGGAAAFGSSGAPFLSPGGGVAIPDDFLEAEMTRNVSVQMMRPAGSSSSSSSLLPSSSLRATSASARKPRPASGAQARRADTGGDGALLAVLPPGPFSYGTLDGGGLVWFGASGSLGGDSLPVIQNYFGGSGYDGSRGSADE
jgi:hypothetical protein